MNRDFDRAELQDPEPRVEELGAVAHHDRDSIALGHPEVPEARGDTPGALGGLRIRDGVVVEDREHSIAVAFRVLVDKSRQVHLSLAFPLTLTIVLCLRSEQQARRQRPRARRYRRHLGPRHLTLARVSAQLEAGLVEVAEAVQPTGRQLATAGRQRQLAGQADALAALDERAALALGRRSRSPSSQYSVSTVKPS